MTAMLALTVSVLVVIAYAVTAQALTSEIDAALESEAQAYSAAMKGAVAGDGLTEATRAYLGGRTARGTGHDVVLLVTFGSGRALSNSDVRLEDAPQNSPARTVGADSGFSSVEFGSTTFRVFSAPVISNGTPVGVFQAAVDTSVNDDAARRVAFTLGAAGLLSLAVVLPLSYWATRRSLAPLRHMAHDAAHISYKRPGQRIEYQGPGDELGSLAETLNEMLDRLEQAHEEQRRFIGDASHELRTPVAIVRGNVELLRRDTLTPEELEESLAIIEDETLRMSRLLDELLALARIEDSQRASLQPLEVRSLLEEAAARTRSLGNREVHIEGPCPLWIQGDPDLLDQVFANLVRNAIDHTREGGRIDFTCTRSDGTAIVHVTDDGTGIPATDIERIFDRFYRSPGQSRSGEAAGAGLGLAIVRRIIELHGGTITAENVPPRGARFVISLPAITTPEDLAE